MDELAEVGATVEALRDGFEAIFVRGVAASSPADRKGLSQRAETWERAGAEHVASRVRGALLAVDSDARDAPEKLLGAYTSLHMFERLLSLEVARETWARYLVAPGTEGGASVRGSGSPSGSTALEDPKGALSLLHDLVKVVEDLVRTGLTNATNATRSKLDASFKEASRRKLLRIGASLRYVNEEVGRFLADDGSFAARRYSFFLHRSWLLARGVADALERGDGQLLHARLGGSGPAPVPVKQLEVVTLGILKRSLASVCTFDVRLRVTGGDPALLGQSLLFSLVFARKANVPAEAYLLLPQPQKYAPKIFREGKVLRVTDAAVSGGRLLLGPKSTITQGGPFDAWEEHYTWDLERVRERVAAHAPTPLDLAVEMQDEVIVHDWQIDPAPLRSTPDREVYALRAGGVVMDATISKDAAELREAFLTAAKKKKRAPLFGTVHYDLGRVVLLPISLLHDEGPLHITLSNETVSMTTLLGSLDLNA